MILELFDVDSVNCEELMAKNVLRKNLQPSFLHCPDQPKIFSVWLQIHTTPTLTLKHTHTHTHTHQKKKKKTKTKNKKKKTKNSLHNNEIIKYRDFRYTYQIYNEFKHLNI